jgi:hypothetical protein
MDENPYKAPEATIGDRPAASRRWLWGAVLCCGLLWLLWLAILHSEILNILMGVYSPLINQTVDSAIGWLAGVNRTVQVGMAGLVVGISIWRLRRSANSASPPSTRL